MVIMPINQCHCCYISDREHSRHDHMLTNVDKSSHCLFLFCICVFFYLFFTFSNCKILPSFLQFCIYAWCILRWTDPWPADGGFSSYCCWGPLPAWVRSKSGNSNHICHTISVLHQNLEENGKSIPDAWNISQDPKDFGFKGNLEGWWGWISGVLVDYGHFLIHNPIWGWIRKSIPLGYAKTSPSNLCR